MPKALGRISFKADSRICYAKNKGTFFLFGLLIQGSETGFFARVFAWCAWYRYDGEYGYPGSEGSEAREARANHRKAHLDRKQD